MTLPACHKLKRVEVRIAPKIETRTKLRVEMGMGEWQGWQGLGDGRMDVGWMQRMWGGCCSEDGGRWQA